MNNSSMFTADRMTHIKIVVMSLIASIAMITVVTQARISDGANAAAETHAVVIKAGKPKAYTDSGHSTVR